jgi:predicted DNA-binding protein
MSTLTRTQLLLEAEQHEALAQMAKQEGRSISDLVREILRDHLAERGREARLRLAAQAIERLAEVRAGLERQRGLYPGSPLAEARAEWEEDVERVWRGEP